MQDGKQLCFNNHYYAIITRKWLNIKNYIHYSYQGRI